MAAEFLTTEYTQSLQKVVEEVVADPKMFRGIELLPSVVVPVSEVYTDVIEASGGMTLEHLVGTDTKYVQNFGTRVQSYKPPAYKEAIHYNERDILDLRKLGDNGRNIRGIQDYISKSVDRLNRRVETRIELQRWRSLMDGGFTFMGKTISFGIPSTNRLTPTVLWSLDGGVTANPAANPIQDLRYWVMGGQANVRKYTFSRLWMNPNTARLILDNPNTRSYLNSYAANPAFGGYDLNKTLGFLLPGMPMVEIYNGWYQEETVIAGRITVGDAQYFLKDGEILFEISNLPGSEKYGEFMQTLHLGGGSIESPAAGKFLIIDDCVGVGTRGGPGNPYIDIIGGVYGGVKLDRPFDVVTAKVIA